MNSPFYVVVTHTANTAARTGVQTVVRGIVRGLSLTAGASYLVQWNKRNETIEFTNRKESEHLGLPEEWDNRPALRQTFARWFGRGGKTERFSVPKASLEGAWLLIPEVAYGRELAHMIAYARRHGMRIAALFHDAIPLTHPTLVRAEAAEHHLEYLKTLCAADVVIAVSEQSRDAFVNVSYEYGFTLPRVGVCSLAAEVIDLARTSPKVSTETEEIHALCVATLDPRKNHLRLIEAFERALVTVPQLRLHLVGDRYKGAEALAANVEKATRTNRNLTWHGKLPAEELNQLFVRCDFSVYPSYIEGFGLPVMESLWHGRPCICANEGSMAQSAAEGGCLTINMQSSAAIADAMISLATDQQLRSKLGAEIAARRLKTWRDYAAELRVTLDDSSTSDAQFR